MRKNDVTHFVRNDVAPEGRNDVMFAHCAVGTTSLPKATSLGEADITCTQGQTSFGDLLYRRSPFGEDFCAEKPHRERPMRLIFFHY